MAKNHDIIDPMLSEEEISDLINKKIAYIIIELEYNPINYYIEENINRGLKSQ